MMHLPAGLIMGMQRCNWEWLAHHVAWLVVQIALEEYDGQMLRFEEPGGYCWVDEDSD